MPGGQLRRTLKRSGPPRSASEEGARSANHTVVRLELGLLSRTAADERGGAMRRHHITRTMLAAVISGRTVSRFDAAGFSLVSVTGHVEDMCSALAGA